MTNIYWKFQAKDLNSDNLMEFKIQDAPEDRADEIAEFLVKYFIPDEAMMESLKIAENLEAVEFARHFFLALMKEKTSLVCFKDGSDDIIAVNLMTILTQQESAKMFENVPDAFADLLSVTKISDQKFHPYEHFKVDKILKSFSMAVHPDYRGRGIATELFKARDPFLKSLGLEVTLAECTGIGSQIASARAGFDCHLTLDLKMAYTKRVTEPLVPRIHGRFKAKDKDSDEIVTYVVQDLPEDKFEDGLKFMMKYFLTDEPMMYSLRIWEDEEAAKLFEDYWRETISQKVSLVCFKENSDEFVGMNVLHIDFQETHKPYEKTGNRTWDAIIDAMNILEANLNVFEHYKVDKFLATFGLLVNPEYRRRGVGTELLRGRISLMKDLDLQVTSSFFSGIGSQTAAKVVGFDENFVIDYEDFPKIQPGLHFPNIGQKCCKLMSLKI